MCLPAGGRLAIFQHGVPVRVWALHEILPAACKGSTQLTCPKELHLDQTKVNRLMSINSRSRTALRWAARMGVSAAFVTLAAVCWRLIQAIPTGSGAKGKPFVPGLQLENRVVHVLDCHRQPGVPCQEEVQLFQGVVAQLSSCRK